MSRMNERREASHYPKTDANHVRQAHERGTYDKAVVHAIIDDAYVAHVAFSFDGRPMVIPMFCARDGQSVLLHGSRKARIFRTIAAGIPLAISIAHLDGLVLARSAFHHSVNYRSVVIQGQAKELQGADKYRALDVIVEHIAKGRSELARRVNGQEDKATMVLRVPLETVSAKIRAAGVKDDDEDMDRQVWAGVVPIETGFGKPEQDKQNDKELPLPNV